MIFKVQTDSTGRHVLVYNKSRDILRQYDETAAKDIMSELGMGAMQKVYVDGSYDLTNEDILLGKKVEPEDW